MLKIEKELGKMELAQRGLAFEPKEKNTNKK